MINKDIFHYNDKNQKHGYWEIYWQTGNLAFKGNYLNGQKIEYWEVYYPNGDLSEKTYYIL